MTVICHWKKKRKEHKMFKLVFKIDLSLFSHWSFGSESQCMHLACKKLYPGGLIKGTSIMIWTKFYTFPYRQEDFLAALQYIKGQREELENNFFQGYVEIRWRGMALTWKKLDLDFRFRYWEKILSCECDEALERVEKLWEPHPWKCLVSSWMGL